MEVTITEGKVMSVAMSTERSPRAAGSRNTKLVMGLLLAVVSSGCAGESAMTPSPAAQLVEAGWSFGFCLGPCRGTLSASADGLSYQVTDRTGADVLAHAEGALTAVGSTRLQTLLAGLPAELLDRYGCPDCADGGAAWIAVQRGGSVQRSDYEYPGPPAELVALDGFLRGVMQALGRCQSSPDVSVAGGCVPVPE